MNMNISLLVVMVLGIGDCLFADAAKSFDDKAHSALSEKATSASNLDAFLKTVLGNIPFVVLPGQHDMGFSNGVDQGLNGKRVFEWIQQGSVDEDYPIIRPRHHFHDPTKPWLQAGWRPPFLGQLGQSSAIWSQDSNQIIGGRHSWSDARDSYFRALVSTSAQERESLFAETFKTLGHLIHLVQDAAVPAHTRNDTHLSYNGIGDPDSFHTWAESVVAQQDIAVIATVPFDISVLNQMSPDAIAPLPFSRLFDSTSGNISSGALNTSSSIGIAEYSNANFFSDDTVNSTAFQYPRSTQLEPHAPELDASGTKMRRYIYFRPGFGQQDYPLAVASVLSGYVNAAIELPALPLDTKVLRAYGQKLFPRAVSHSAGLIDYCFRGRLQAGWTLCGTHFIGVRSANPSETVGNGVAALVFWSEKYQRLFVQAAMPVIPYDPYGVGDGFGVQYLRHDAIGAPEDWVDDGVVGFVIYRGRIGYEEDGIAISQNIGSPGYCFGGT